MDYIKRNFKCEECLFYDQCEDEEICEDFSPVDEMDDRWIDKYIEVRRIEFRKECFDEVEFGDDENMEDWRK